MDSIGAAPARPNKAIKTYLPPGECRDVIDYTVIKFGMEICCRGSIGSYLHACPHQVDSTTVNATANTSVVNMSMNQSVANMSQMQPLKTTSHGPITIFTLGVTGQGVGETMDCLSFVNIDKRYVLLTS